MSRFASSIMRRMHEVTRKLEVSLGPDTGDLTLRIGLHSGPVTAGKSCVQSRFDEARAEINIYES